MAAELDHCQFTILSFPPHYKKMPRETPDISRLFWDGQSPH